MSIFLSHSRKDPTRDKVFEDLLAEGYQVFYDVEHLDISDNWKIKVTNEIKSSQGIILLVNHESCNSSFVAFEIEVANKEDKLIFPIKTGDYSREDADLVGIDYDAHFGDLVSDKWRDVMYRLFNSLIHKQIKKDESLITKISQDEGHYILFLRDQIQKVQTARLPHYLETHIEAYLKDIFVSIPTDFSISISTKNKILVEYQLNNDPQFGLKENVTLDYEGLNFILNHIKTDIFDGIDERYQKPQQLPLLFAPNWYDGLKENYWNVDILNACCLFQYSIVIGGPGTGKSVFAKYLTFYLLSKEINRNTLNTNDKDINAWQSKFILPLYIEIREFLKYVDLQNSSSRITYIELLNYVQSIMLNEYNIGCFEIVKLKMQQGKVMFIFDGIDEIVIQNSDSISIIRGQINSFIKSLRSIFNKCRIILTVRESGYAGWEIPRFQAIHLKQLDINAIYKLSHNVFKISELGWINLDESVSAFLNEMKSLPADLKDRALFVTLLASLYHKKKALPKNKCELYRESIDLLLSRWTKKNSSNKSLLDMLGLTKIELIEKLREIAFRNHSNSLGESHIENIDYVMLSSELFGFGEERDIDPVKVLRYLSMESGILEEIKPKSYKFPHRSFQEYLSAEYLVSLDLLGNIYDAITEQPLLWQEVHLMVGSILKIQNKLHALWDLVDLLIQRYKDDKSQNKKDWALWLISRLIYDQELFLANVNNKSVINECKKAFKNFFSRKNILPIAYLADISSTLCVLGDDRVGVGLNKNSLPDIDWCKIPEGNFTLGLELDKIEFLSKTTGLEGFDLSRELAGQTIFVDEFYISKYPITESQFETFIFDKEGYYNQKWWNWSKYSLEWFNKFGIQTKKSDNILYTANLPKTNITWYEAMAFCYWLSEILNANIRLPSEIQWEKAARGNDARIYSWGNEFDLNRCNCKLTGINKLIPVGSIKIHDGPWGANSPSDMCGNVWEWCSTNCEKIGGKECINEERENINLSEDYLRMVRGGSFYNTPFFIRTTFKGRDKPSIRWQIQGFRIIKSK